ncbi:hypothetical protein CO151_00600 [bacterium CG_4_9_14_3_um_filter_65_15]|nr:MAG: hypothetical protein CO151_00600 [bacterium CG_4_9_14_3_um_filter_65_15]
MKTKLMTGVLLLAALLLIGCSGGGEGDAQPAADQKTEVAATPAVYPALPVTEDEALLRCKAAAAALGSNLKTALKQAMQDGGPVAALEVCNVQAPAIAAAIDEREGITVGRTSLKWRNPDNAPDAWERGVLEKFAADKSGGASTLDLETWAVVPGPDGGRDFRYMKAIPTLSLCLKCHGADVAPDVAEKIRTLYPADHATGYGLGDLRGAFSVSIAMAEVGDGGD